MEEHIMNRIQEISDEYAQLKELDKYDLTLEAVGEHGDVKVTLKKGDTSFEKVIKHDEPLDFISDTFQYPDTFSHNSKDISLNHLRRAYFNEFGRLVVERSDSTEIFRVQDRHREKVTEILKEKLGNKFKA